MLKEFRDFALRGNVLDLAVAVILGTAFGKIVTSLVDDILMPPLGLLLGGMDFKELFIDLSRGGYATLAPGAGRGRAGHPLRPVPERADRVHDRRLRAVPGDPPVQPLLSEARARGHARVPAVPVPDPAEGHPLRALHGGARGGLESATAASGRARSARP